jgi:hypothetical protein
MKFSAPLRMVMPIASCARTDLDRSHVLSDNAGGWRQSAARRLVAQETIRRATRTGGGMNAMTHVNATRFVRCDVPCKMRLRGTLLM